MTIDLSQIKENSMVRYGFKILLMREFDIHIKENDYNRLIAAAGCIEIYDSMEEFLEKSGWKRDNPELGEKAIYWITIFAGISREKSGIFQGFGTRTKRREEKVELFYKAIDFYNKSC